MEARRRCSRMQVVVTTVGKRDVNARYGTFEGREEECVGKSEDVDTHVSCASIVGLRTNNVAASTPLITFTITYPTPHRITNDELFILIKAYQFTPPPIHLLNNRTEASLAQPATWGIIPFAWLFSFRFHHKEKCKYKKAEVWYSKGKKQKLFGWFGLVVRVGKVRPYPWRQVKE